MSDLTRALASFSWAQTAFAAEQTVHLGTGSSTKVKAGLYSVTSTIQEQFSSNPIFYAINQLGDGVQRTAVDVSWDILRLKALTPQWIGRAGGHVVRAALDAAISLAPAENLEATWHLARNTFAVIGLVNRASAMLSLPPGTINLKDAVERAYSLGGDYGSLWLIEGLGEEYAKRNWTSTRPPRGLLTSGQAVELPAQSLLMMHAGMGIAFARRAVHALTPFSADEQIAAALEEFLALVQTNARPGYEGSALESLGLVTRTWYPQMVEAVDRHLWILDKEALEYFWHGVGRATYFTPQYLLPGASPFRGVAGIAPHQLAYQNAIAGAAWAFALVNIQQPGVVLNLLKKDGAKLAGDDAFSNGVASTLMMALDMIPGDPFALRFAEYRPYPDSEELANLWDRMVHQPCRFAIDRALPILQRRRRVGEVFRYQELQSLAADREGRS